MSRPKYTIRLLRIAEEDLAEIISYIAADRPSAAEGIASEMEKNLQLLSKHPHLGRIPNEEDLLKLGYRYLVVQSYLIFCIVEGQTIYVHRILHGARDYLNLL